MNKRNKKTKKYGKTNNKSRQKVHKLFFTKEDIFISRMASILRTPHQNVKRMFWERAFTTIRLNSLADNPEKIKYLLEKKGLKLSPVRWLQDTFFVMNKDKSELGELNEYHKGLFYIQNLSSMLPVIALEPKPGEIILDLCAAPGSKTTQIAVYTRNKGEIIANDNNLSRLNKLQKILKLFRVKNVQIHQGDGTLINQEYENYFDKVLLDAPCSGEGLIYFGSPDPLKYWSIRKTKALSKLQRQLISSAFESLKKGGILVYSTCTLEPIENEDVVNYLLNSYPDAELEEISLFKNPDYLDMGKTYLKGITKWNEFTFGDEMKKCIRIIPSGRMMGFFIARIKKL